ncbi:MAG: sulfate transporter CysZ [Gammaproteobacteria bacterium]|nr:sulfate transporter CysZ [Gammaproteobacteria bacterium]
MGVFAGIRYFTRGANLAFSDDYRAFVWMPALCSFAVIALGLYVAFGYITEFSTYLQNKFDIWPDFISWVVAPLLYTVGVLVGTWLFGFLAIIVGSPFLTELSLRVNSLPASAIPTPTLWKQVSASLARELRKLLYHIPRLLGLLLFSLIPLVNVFAPLLWLGFGAWLMAIQFCDYATENRDQPFSETLLIVRRHRATCLGFGVCVTLAMAVPGVNFIVAPVAVIGATLMMRSFTALPTQSISTTS